MLLKEEVDEADVNMILSDFDSSEMDGMDANGKVARVQRVLQDIQQLHTKNEEERDRERTRHAREAAARELKKKTIVDKLVRHGMPDAESRVPEDLRADPEEIFRNLLVEYTKGTRFTE